MAPILQSRQALRRDHIRADDHTVDFFALMAHSDPSDGRRKKEERNMSRQSRRAIEVSG